MFDARIVGISGKNGVGKTNLLDAIYYLCYTKSYFQNKDRNNVNNEHEGFRIEGIWNSENHFEKTTCMFKEGKKVISQDDIAYEKIADHIGKYHAVMIAPDDLDIINDGSETRRKFIDGLLAQTNKDYLENLLSYQRTLKQKNTYLKQAPTGHFDQNLLDIYDTQLAQFGSVLLKQRHLLSAYLPEKIQSFYQKLCKNANEEIGFFYQACTQPENLRGLFQQYRPYDMEYKRTVKGPHTDDWLFTINENSLKSYASQGQKKSFLIGLKLAQLSWLQQSDKTLILLMDDIFEKLDKYRLDRLFKLLPSFGLAQLFITHTELVALRKVLPLYDTDFQIIEL